jgi:hypothetical protein
MAYLCLTNRLLSSGSVQVLDLFPKTSLRRPGIDPAGETGYINPYQDDEIVLNADGTLATPEAFGLRAYILDHCRPGATQTASGTATVLAGLVAGDTVTVAGVAFLAVAGVANPAAQEFEDVATSGSVGATATALAAAVNNAASIVLMKAASATNYASALAGGAVVTFSAKDNAGAALLGAAGALLTLTTNAPTHVTLSPLTGTLALAAGGWTALLLETVAGAIIVRLRAGQSLTLADVNTALSAAGATFNTGGATGVLTDLLSILAGRGYRITRYVPGTLSLNQYMLAGAWVTTARGSFTEAVLVNGGTWNRGEIRPATPGGDTEQREFRPIRVFTENAQFTLSLASGSLKTLTVKPGAPSVTLWPDSDRLPHHTTDMQPGYHYAQADGARVVVAYDALGNVL